MNTLIAYLISSSVSLGIFYAAYYLFLRSGACFRMNRFYLLTSLVLSFLLPFLGSKHSLSDVLPISVISGSILQTITLTPVEIGNSTGRFSDLIFLFGYLYLSVMIILSARLLFQFFLLLKFRRSATASYIARKKIYWINGNISPFSFFRSIYLPIDIKDMADLKDIIRHEQVHIREFHSFDILLLRVLKIFFWVNPFIYLFEKSLHEVHEFLADKKVVQSGSDPVAYSRLLLIQNESTKPLLFINNFNYSLIKRRLIMFNKKSNRFAGIKTMTILSIALLIVSLYSFANNLPGTRQEANLSKTVTVPNPAHLLSEPDTTVFTTVEKMPQFPGGEKAMVEYMLNNIKYPDEARKKGIQGTAYITFVVEPDGSVTNVKVLKGFDKLCDEEAFRVVKAMPKWEPGMQKGKAVRVQFNLPLKFKL